MRFIYRRIFIHFSNLNYLLQERRKEEERNRRTWEDFAASNDAKALQIGEEDEEQKRSVHWLELSGIEN